MSAAKEVLGALGAFFLYAVVAVFAQSAIFTRALGVSRLVKLVDDDNVSSVTFCALLCAIQLIGAPIAYFTNIWFSTLEYRAYFRPLVYVLCTSLAFIIVLVFVALALRKKGAKDILAVLPMAAFNCCVLGTMLISTTQSFTFLQTMGFALGSALGYVLAVLVVTEGQRKLQNRNVPAPFKGLPVTLLYIGVLALAIYGFTGHMQSF